MRILALHLAPLFLYLLLSGCADSDLSNPGPAGPGPFTPDAHDDPRSQRLEFVDLSNRPSPFNFFDNVEILTRHDEIDPAPDSISIEFVLCPIQVAGTITNVNNFTATGTFFTQPITMIGTITPFRATLTLDASTVCEWDLKEQTLGLLPCDQVILNEPQLLTICP